VADKATIKLKGSAQKMNGAMFAPLPADQKGRGF
jgi:hypothetical protein